MASPIHRFRRSLLVVLGIASSMGVEALQAEPVVIDSFDWGAGPATVTADSEATFTNPSVLGGEVVVRTRHYLGQRAVYQAGSGELYLENEEAYYPDFYFEYGFDGHALPSVDLTGGGTNNALLLDVNEVEGDWVIHLRIDTMAGPYVLDYVGIATDANSTGTVVIPFSDFINSFDPSSVVGIQLRFEPYSSNGSIRISHFRAGVDGGEPSPVAYVDPAPLTEDGPMHVLLKDTAIDYEDDGDADFGYLDFYEEFDPGIDLTSAGANDRFVLEVTEVEGEFSLAFSAGKNLSSEWFRVAFFIDSPGEVEIPFQWLGENFDPTDMGLLSVFILSQDYYTNGGRGAETISIASVRTDGPVSGSGMPDGPSLPRSAVDVSKPTLKLTNQRALRKPRSRHRIKGIASDNVGVAKVEVRLRGRGWRSVRLQKDGRWGYRASKFSRFGNRYKFRAFDTSGNRSSLLKVRVRDFSKKPVPSSGKPTAPF